MSKLASKYTGSTIFTVCIVYTMVCSRLSIACWHFQTFYAGKIFRGQVVTVLKWGSRQIRPRYFTFFSLLFYKFWGCGVPYTCYLGFFLIFFTYFVGASYTRLQHIHRRIRYSKYKCKLLLATLLVFFTSMNYYILFYKHILILLPL